MATKSSATKSSKSTKSTKPALAAVPKAEAPVPTPEQAAPAVKAPLMAVVADADDMDDGPAPKGDGVKMKELLAAVVEKTGAKKKDAKEIVDAALAEIAAALTAGKSLSLPPLGNLRVAKTQEKGGATMMVLKLRMGGSGGGGGEGGKGTKDALAEGGEDS
jgi:hypothetical protein